MNDDRIAKPRAGLLLTALSGVALVCPATSHAAIAQAAGGSGYSGVLSSNASIRRQQVTCDPMTGPGSATVIYDPSVVQLVSIYNEPGYAVNSAATYVGYTGGSVPMLSAASSYFAYAAKGISGVAYTGTVQVSWTPDPTQTAVGSDYLGNAPSTLTFSPVASYGTGDGGANVFGLEFAYLPGVSDDTPASYTIEAATTTETVSNLNPDGSSAASSGNNSVDYLTDVTDPDAPVTITNTDDTPITSAIVAGGVPEPSGAVLLALGAIGSLARWRKRHNR